MNDRGIVVSMQDGNIMVMAMKSSSCAGCMSECSRKSDTFAVANRLNLDVKVGSVVKLKATKKLQLLQGAVSLLVPILCAVAGYFLSGPVCALLGKTAGDGEQALGVLIPFLLSSALVFFLTRKFPMPGTPEIVEVL